MTGRRGYTLIEMIVVITGTSIIMAVGVGTLHTLMRTERQAAETMGYSHSAARLTEQLRDDVHAANTAEPSEQGAELRLSLPRNRRIAYTQSVGEIVRLEATGNKSQRRESYQLRAGVNARFSALEDGDASVIRMVLVRKEPAGKSSTMAAANAVRRKAPAWSVDAVMAKDHRFAGETP